MSLAAQVANDQTQTRLSFDYQKFVTRFTAFFVFCGMMSIFEPSPYDFAALVAIPLWFFGGFTLNRFLLAIILFWTLREFAAFAALMPYWDEPDPRLFQFQSLYLYVTVVFFTIYFAERTQSRLDACMKAYVASAVVSAIVAIMSYIGLFGLDALTTVEGRVAGTFKDPNVFGSYLTLGAVLLMQGLLLGRTRHMILSLVSLAIVLVGVFLSFSRGSWGATIFALMLMSGASFATHSEPRTRRRIIVMALVSVAAVALILIVILSQDSIREFFLQRAALSQEYDEGVTGRFGNQLRSIPMLLERPFGFGPLRFRLVFDLEPHNSNIGAFANGGWIGGFCWLALAAATIYVGFRLMFARTPFQTYAQAIFPTLFALLLQGFQIDIDHWRQLFLMFGVLWGLECARRRWLAGPERSAPA